MCIFCNVCWLTPYNAFSSQISLLDKYCRSNRLLSSIMLIDLFHMLQTLIVCANERRSKLNESNIEINVSMKQNLEQ